MQRVNGVDISFNWRDTFATTTFGYKYDNEARPFCRDRGIESGRKKLSKG